MAERANRSVKYSKISVAYRPAISSAKRRCSHLHPHQETESDCTMYQAQLRLQPLEAQTSVGEVWTMRLTAPTSCRRRLA